MKYSNICCSVTQHGDKNHCKSIKSTSLLKSAYVQVMCTAFWCQGQ